MRVAVCAVLAAGLLSPAVAPAQDSVERSRAIHRLLVDGRTAELSRQLTAEYLREIGGETALATLAAKVRGDREVSLMDERAYLRRGRVSYVRVSRFRTAGDMNTSVAWSDDGKVVRLSFEPMASPAPTARLNYQTRTVLRLPFGAPEGGFWYVTEGGRDPLSNYHAVASDQRFAYDFVVMRGAKSFAGDGARNEDYFCWNEPLYAPADGRVVHAVGDVADNPSPGRRAGSGPGNHVVLDHGHGEYALIAHFRAGSLAVRRGAQVRAGDLLGRCGNSGGSIAPHVHFHLQDGSEYRANAGLPAFFQSYFSSGRYVSRGEPERGELLLPDPALTR